MARSTVIYLVVQFPCMADMYTVPRGILAAFTVKHEAISWIEREKPFGVVALTRYPDNPGPRDRRSPEEIGRWRDGVPCTP